MTDDILKGNWRQLRGRIQQKWGELTDDDLDQIEGRRDQLIGKLQARYGYARAEAEDEINELFEDWTTFPTHSPGWIDGPGGSGQCWAKR